MSQMKVSAVPVISSCPHLASPQVLWIESGPGEAPEFCFSGFPNAGRVVLSKNTMVIVCHRCARELNDLQKPVANQVHLTS